MNLSIVIIFILIVTVIGAYFIFKTPSTSVTSSKISPPTTTSTVTADETAILSDQINSLSDEELAAISTDMSDFSTSTESSISQDTGLFYYE